MLKDIEPIVSLPKSVIKKTISISEKIKDIRHLISKEAELSFQGLMKKSRSKTEVVVTFLALLELVKQRSVVVFQNNIFEDITIKRNHVD